MHPVHFEGSTEIKKPADMTDEECMSLWAKFGFCKMIEVFNLKGQGINVELPGLVAGIDTANHPYYLTAWKPSYEDLQSLNRGEPIYIKTLAQQLPPMAVFTLDENGDGNF
jgi:hypothetical protein